MSFKCCIGHDEREVLLEALRERVDMLKEMRTMLSPGAKDLVLSEAWRNDQVSQARKLIRTVENMQTC